MAHSLQEELTLLVIDQVNYRVHTRINMTQVRSELQYKYYDQSMPSSILLAY